jgi:hypothetical protein
MEKYELQPIGEQDYIDSAAIIGCDVATIKAVAEVEGAGSGFFQSGTVKILFEPHIFWQQLRKKGMSEAQLKNYQLKQGYGDVLYKKWKTLPYVKGDENWDKLRKAALIDIDSAYASASFGMFQIMGFNYFKCGFKNIFEFADAMNRGERYHLKAFIQFIAYTGLGKYLKARQWGEFAKRYNGAGYKNSPDTVLDDYDYKLEKAYQKFVKSK